MNSLMFLLGEIWYAAKSKSKLQSPRLFDIAMLSATKTAGSESGEVATREDRPNV